MHAQVKTMKAHTSACTVISKPKLCILRLFSSLQFLDSCQILLFSYITVFYILTTYFLGVMLLRDLKI